MHFARRMKAMIHKEETKKVREEQPAWTICQECKGHGKISQRLRKKVRMDYEMAVYQYEKNKDTAEPPVRPKRHLAACLSCKGSGLVHASEHPTADIENYPHLAIIGGGIGGMALAVACFHRGIPFTLYERDSSFDVRAQGYGLTLQQASKAMKAFGIFSLQEGVNSTRHLMHTTEGKVIGEWGMRKWKRPDSQTAPKHINVHIARQSLRLALLNQLGGHDAVQWGHQLVSMKKSEDESVELLFQVDGKTKTAKADMVVGADGIRSAVRRLLFGEDLSPLRYLGCIVILGICPLSTLDGLDSPLLDSATVFQTANGNERIYIMPFTTDSVMWQLSFPIAEIEAKYLSAQGTKALKEEACRRTQWHNPIPQMIAATQEAQITGYPVYDRELLNPETLSNAGPITLIGDAAHPMSPFKGQGANQALIDALLLARQIYKAAGPFSQWRDAGIRKIILTDFEAEMLERSSIKVKDSEEAAHFLHSEMVLEKADEPRGKALRKNKS